MYNPAPWGMNALVMEAFALEVLYQQGGYHVPLSVPWAKASDIFGLVDGANASALVTPSLDPSKDDSPFSAASIKTGFVEQESLGIVGAAAGSPALLERIKALLRKSERPVAAKEVYPRMLAPLDGQT
eukprot:2302148-Rhodomonas_salina.1